MNADPIVGLIVPPAEGAVPYEGPRLYPEGVRFVAQGLGLQRLTPAGYDTVIDRVAEVAASLASQGVAAIAVMGTSLTFYRGRAFHDELEQTVRAATGLPVTTMSRGVIEALQALDVRRVAVGTAYVEEVNARLRQFLTDSGFEVLALEGLGIDVVGGPKSVPPAQLVELGQRVLAAAPGAEGIFLSCGGLRTLDVTVPLEAATGVPVVSSTPAAFWAAVRLVGHPGAAPGYGRLFALDPSAASAVTAS